MDPQIPRDRDIAGRWYGDDVNAPIRLTRSCGTATLRKADDGELEVLLIQARADRDLWGFPKGHVEDGEDDLITASRETTEETGVEAAVFDVLLGSTRVQSRGEDKAVAVYYALAVDPDADPEPADEENHAAAWWPVSSLPEPVRSQRDMFDDLLRTAEAFYEWASEQDDEAD